MGVVVVAGSSGLIGSEAAIRFHGRGFEVWGIDNDMRAEFFGPEASTAWMRRRLEEMAGYRHFDLDIRHRDAVEWLFRDGGGDVDMVIHAAAQASHDWAAINPRLDFKVNSVGTLNLLEAVRGHSPEVVFVFLSTNKVYGDSPNRLDLIEEETRFELPYHSYYRGIPRPSPIDRPS